MKIDNDRTLPPLATMDDGQLIAQELVQQWAIHAVSFLMAHGVSKKTCAEMVDSIQRHAQLIAAEIRSRGMETNFECDQVVSESVVFGVFDKSEGWVYELPAPGGTYKTVFSTTKPTDPRCLNRREVFSILDTLPLEKK